MTGQVGALLLAIGFALGCAGIYNLPPRVRVGMGILLRVTLCFVPAVCAMALSREREMPSHCRLLKVAGIIVAE